MAQQKKRVMGDVMTPMPHSIGLDQKINVAREMMRTYGIRHLPVQNGGKLEGVLSHRDVQFALALVKDGELELSVEDIYTPEPYSVTFDTPLHEAAQKMSEERFGCALVTNHEGKLVGIFTATDACRELANETR